MKTAIIISLILSSWYLSFKPADRCNEPQPSPSVTVSPSVLPSVNETTLQEELKGYL